MAYTPQYYPGSISVGRRKHRSHCLEKLRDIPEADTVATMSSRASGSYCSIIPQSHPKLSEKKIQKLIQLRGGNKK